MSHRGVRWQHPARGLLSPGEFVGLAEQAGLMRELTTHVLGAAVAHAARWCAAGRAIDVAVNVTATDLMDVRFPDERRRVSPSRPTGSVARPARPRGQ